VRRRETEKASQKLKIDKKAGDEDDQGRYQLSIEAGEREPGVWRNTRGQWIAMRCRKLDGGPADKGGYLGQHLAGPLVFRPGVEEIEKETKEIRRGVFGENPSKSFLVCKYSRSAQPGIVRIAPQTTQDDPLASSKPAHAHCPRLAVLHSKRSSSRAVRQRPRPLQRSGQG
jgi:hypothetical protein